MGATATRTRSALLTAWAAALVACGGTGDVAHQPTPTPTAGTSVPDDAPPVDAVLVDFATGGGCFDTAEPVGCGEHPWGRIADADDRAVVAGSAARLAAVPAGDNGCGDEFVDGVSSRATVTLLDLDGGRTTHEICLPALDGDDPAAAVLSSLYEQARAADDATDLGAPGPAPATSP